MFSFLKNRNKSKQRSESAEQADKAAHILLGRSGEDFASDYFRLKGYRVLERNWRKGRYELDLVCEENGTIVFVEVKTRSSDNLGGPLSGINSDKLNTLFKAIREWQNAHDAWDKPCRLDILALIREKSSYKAEHYVNAIQQSWSDTDSNTTWQPW